MEMIKQMNIIRTCKTPVLGAMIIFLTMTIAVTASADSLFTKKAEGRGSLFSDERVRFENGDMITILISETTSAKTESNTGTDKESKLDASAESEFLTDKKGLNWINEKMLPNWKFNAKNEFDGGGSTSRKTNFTSTITVFVTKVLDNGNLEVRGEKEVLVNRERSKLVLTGVIRARDVTAANTVLSSQIGDLKTEFEGRGPIWNSERRGFSTKLLDWVVPF